MSLLTCALSGETPPTDPVVTPSGHIVSRRLLLSKLTENGGYDPFDKSTSNPRTLDESDLISLKLDGAGKDAVVPPRLPSAASLPSLLTQVQVEYDALLLELYDTRQTLEETRRELSQALYQNDAAVRVVARLSMERDGAREQLADASARLDAAVARAASAGAEAEGTADGQQRKRSRDEDATMDVDQPGPKKPAVVVEEAAEAAGAANKKIPKADLDAMVALWKTLSKERKSKAKKAKAAAGADKKAAITIEDIKAYTETSKKSLHKSSAKAGVLSLALDNAKHLVTGGKDKQAVVYDTLTGKVVATLTGSRGDVNTVDIHRRSDGTAVIATGSADGCVRAYTRTGPEGGDYVLSGTASVDDADGDGDDAASPVTSVTVQPTGDYVLATTQSGNIAFLSINAGDDGDGDGDGEGSVKLLAVFGGDNNNSGEDGKDNNGVEYTCGGFHPDGLVCCVGTADGRLQVWDLKSQTLAETLQCHGGSKPVTSLSFSENGYHFASSTSDGTVQVWDLRKLKNVATLNEDGADVGTVKSVAFDPTGKFLAYGGSDGTITVAVVKEWDSRVVLSQSGGGTKKGGVKKGITGVVWATNEGEGEGDGGDGGNKVASIVTCSDAERPVRFWGAA